MLTTQSHINTNKNRLFVSSDMNCEAITNTLKSIIVSKYIKGQNRAQDTLFPVSLDDAVDTENEVRLIDLFVNSLKLEEFGFRVDHIENGRPALARADLQSVCN